MLVSILFVVVLRVLIGYFFVEMVFLYWQSFLRFLWTNIIIIVTAGAVVMLSTRIIEVIGVVTSLVIRVMVLFWWSKVEL